MSGRWDSPGVPHRGWECVDVEDLGEAVGSCEMCGQESVRYLHLMEHPEFAQRLAVGCVCAEKMTNDYVGPRRREQALMNRASRRSKWLSRKWSISAKGNPYLNVDGHNVVVFRDRYNAESWKYSVDNERVPRAYRTEEEAKLAAFDALWP